MEIIIWWKYNNLTILEYLDSKNYKKRVLCKCICWNEKIIYVHNIKSWMSKWCWCKRWKTIHWLSNTEIYKAYVAIISRCYNNNHKQYYLWWWRWIRCEWNTFEEFYSDMKDSWKKWLSIDRINNNWNYCKDNCRWVDDFVQANNKRNTKFIEWIPSKMFYNQNNKYWINYTTFASRVFRNWIDPYIALKNKYK